VVVHPFRSGQDRRRVIGPMRRPIRAKVNFGSAGAGTAATSPANICAFRRLTLVHIPYSGHRSALTDCWAATFPMAFAPIRPASHPTSRPAKLRAIRGDSITRSGCFADVPPWSEGACRLRRVAFLRSRRAGRDAASDHRQVQQGAARRTRFRRGVRSRLGNDGHRDPAGHAGDLRRI